MKHEAGSPHPCGCPSSTVLTQYFDKGETDFFRCNACTLVFRQPMPTPDELDRIYRDHYAEANVSLGTTNQESGDHALDAYARYLHGRLIEPGHRVVDFGCGTGALVEKLRQAGIEHAQGLENAADARAFCATHRAIGLLASLDEIGAQSVDVITMIEVIEHLTTPLADMVALRAKLKPGGQVFITTPNRQGTRARAEAGFWREACKKFHLVLFDARAMETLLQRAGFVHIQRIRFSPVQRSGLPRWLATRAQQALGLGGTLCFTAKAPAR